MRTVAFQEALHGTARLIGMTPRELNDARATTITEYLNSVLRPMWQHDWWPETLQVERRTYRPAYAPGAFVAAGTEWFHVGSNAYYQALQLQGSATVPPATYSANVWTVNAAHWALSASRYTAPFQTDGETLSVGDQRLDRDNGQVYAVHTAHTASGQTVDSTKATALTPLRRYVAFQQEGRNPIGTVKGVHTQDPRACPGRSGPVRHTVTEGGIILPDSALTQPWIEYRRPVPSFTSSRWVQPAASQGYDAGALVYYNTGVFKSLVGNNESALDNVAQWEYVGFPEWLLLPAKLAAAALLLTDQKQNRRAAELNTQAEIELSRVRDQEIHAQTEPETAEVCTYR